MHATGTEGTAFSPVFFYVKRFLYCTSAKHRLLMESLRSSWYYWTVTSARHERIKLHLNNANGWQGTCWIVPRSPAMAERKLLRGEGHRLSISIPHPWPGLEEIWKCKSDELFRSLGVSQWFDLGCANGTMIGTGYSNGTMVDLGCSNDKTGCLRFTKFCWVGKHINIIVKPTNSPIQGRPNPRKIRLKVASGPLFPTANEFSWVGIDFI